MDSELDGPYLVGSSAGGQANVASTASSAQFGGGSREGKALAGQEGDL